MRLKLKILCFATLSLSSFSSIGQSTTKAKYLTQVGLVDSLYSETLGEMREFYVAFPLGYSETSQFKYPVTYILDGENLLSSLHEVQNYYSGGFTPEMILVGIANRKNRVRDLTPSAISSRKGTPIRAESGKSENFLSFIEKELIPYIEAKYPVTNYRTLIGHSFGGLFTVNTLIHKPELFDNYLAIDPSLDWDEMKLVKDLKAGFPAPKYNGKSLFISMSGQLHMQRPDITIDNVREDNSDFTLFSRSILLCKDYLEQVSDTNFHFYWKFYPNDLHGTIPYPSLREGMVNLFHWYQMEDTYKINSFDTSTEELRRIIEHRDQKLQKHFGYAVPPYPEELLTISGYMNMDMAMMDRARMYFEFAMKYYPESANTYDSMADYYETLKDYKQAIFYVNKAFEIKQDDYYLERLESLKNKQ